MPDQTTTQSPDVATPSVESTAAPVATAQPLNVQVSERLEDADKTALDLVKAKRETAAMNAKLAVSQGETAELTYNNLVLRLALKYRLSDGDLLGEDGTITRKS